MSHCPFVMVGDPFNAHVVRLLLTPHAELSRFVPWLVAICIVVAPGTSATHWTEVTVTVADNALMHSAERASETWSTPFVPLPS